MQDALGAFLAEPEVHVAGAPDGPLAGATFAAKDAFDIAGFPTGFGNPDWRRTHAVPAESASAVRRLLDAGATLIGKTHTDELTYSLNGENAHYGTPVNPAAPGRIPGGSSSGSAAAVAGGLADFALGTDTGGSVRLPASHCGIYGFRPTHGRVANDGVLPLAPSFDTVGWFARDTDLLYRIGRQLLGGDAPPGWRPRLLLAHDAFDLAEAAARPALVSAARRLSESLGEMTGCSIYEGETNAWLNAFLQLQGSEVWQCHGDWIREVQPKLGPGIRERFEWAASLDPADSAAADDLRRSVRHRLREVLGENSLLCLPTCPDTAPACGVPPAGQTPYRMQALRLLCIAGLAGLPQVSLPLASHDSRPLGLSLIGPAGSDLQLLGLLAENT